MVSRDAVVNFSLRKEVFFVVAGSVAGGAILHLSILFTDLLGTGSYHATLLAAARIAGSSAPEAGLILHFAVSTIIGIATGVIMHRVLKFDISKTVRGLAYGALAGVVVFVVFAIPVYEFLLVPSSAHVLAELNSNITPDEGAGLVRAQLPEILARSLLYHIIWGLTLGALSSALTRKLGANYRCHRCDIEFSRLHTYEEHQRIHEDPPPPMKRILILGGGYAGINVLTAIQKRFERDTGVDIALVSESNYFLHTPMLAEMATGTIEARHIATPIRTFCRRARFYQATVRDIDLKSKNVAIRRGKDNDEILLQYDYLVMALGGRTNFFGNKQIERNSMTIKTLDDAIRLRNHIISALEEADQETDAEKQSRLVTFVIVGGGFSGVETAGELNDFVRESVSKFYRNIDPEKLRVILVSSGDAILPEIGDLGKYAAESLKRAGVKIITGTRLKDASPNGAMLNTGETIPCATLIWAGGVTVDDVVSTLDVQHHKGGRLIVDSHLRIPEQDTVYALGDCALVTDPRTNKPYPPTAQHAIRQARTVSANLACAIRGRDPEHTFEYIAKGSMAKIGRRDGVALLLGFKFRGMAAWLIWKQYYLSTLPTAEKRIRVGLDWFVDLFFPKDITGLS